MDFTPTTYIYGAKAAPGYKVAKGIIRLINDIAQIINGVVLSKKDKEPIIGAIFTNEKDSLLYYSDKYGNFYKNSEIYFDEIQLLAVKNYKLGV